MSPSHCLVECLLTNFYKLIVLLPLVYHFMKYLTRWYSKPVYNSGVQSMAQLNAEFKKQWASWKHWELLGKSCARSSKDVGFRFSATV